MTPEQQNAQEAIVGKIKDCYDLNHMCESDRDDAAWNILNEVLSDPVLVAKAMGMTVETETARQLVDGTYTLGSHYPTHERAVWREREWRKTDG